MSQNLPFLAGVIEGFYGKAWSQGDREAYAGYLARLGLNTYIYCPKSDAVLRKQWRDRWDAAFLRELQALGKSYRSRGLYWGVGLSPFALYRNYCPQERAALREKLAYLAELDAPLLALLFDDMPGDLDDLAGRQAEIVRDVCDWLPGVRILVCPTYYSYDPVLEKVFGPRATDYWTSLGASLPSEVEIFWTGNAVCSASVTPDDLQAIRAELGRPVVLWDNYPVNDSAQRCQHLYTSALADREGLGPYLAGHLCNPMNQAHLSLPALTGLARLYGKPPEETELAAQLGEAFWARYGIDARRFEEGGLVALESAERESLAAEYACLPGPAAGEVARWLRGEYTFDPACLTD
jgi:hypothetical protein